MSDVFDDDEDGDEDEGSSNLVKDLRRQLKAQKKANEEMAEALQPFLKAQRTASVAKLIEDSGGNPAYAEFYNAEDTSESTVKAWIESKSSLLGIQPKEEPDPQADQVRGITSATANAPTPKLGGKEDLASALSAAKTRAELDAAQEAIFRAARG